MINFESFTDILDEEMDDSPPFSFSPSSTMKDEYQNVSNLNVSNKDNTVRPAKNTGEHQGRRSVQEIAPKYRDVFSFQYFNNVQTKVIEDALYSDKSLVVCAPTGSGKTAIFEMTIVKLLIEMEEKNLNQDFKIIYMAPIKAICTERLTEWYPKFTKYNALCIEVTGDTDVEFSQLKPYTIIITTPEKWDMLTRRWRDYRGMVEVIKLFLIDEVHILNDVTRGPVLEAVVSRMKTIQTSIQSTYRIEQLQNQGNIDITQIEANAPKIRFVAASATVGNPEDVAEWLGTTNKHAVFHKFGDECRPVKLKLVVEGYPCAEGTSTFKFDITLNYKLWPVIHRYHNSKPTLIFCNTRKGVVLTAETLSREISIAFDAEQRAKLTALASTIKTKKIQSLILCGIGCHHAGLLFEERVNIERAFRNGDLPILISTTTLAMGVNLPAHLVIIKNTQQYVNGTYQEYSISTVLQMVGRAGRPQFDTEATAVIMTRQADKAKYQALVGGCEPLQSYLHKRLAENLNSEVALGTVIDLAQCVEWVRSTFLFVRAARDPRMYLGLPQSAPADLVSKKIEELCTKAMNSLESSGLITKDELCCIQSTEAGRLLSIHYLDLETMKHIMKIKGDESLEQLLWVVCESHELSDMHLRVDERRCLNALNRNNMAATIRFPMKGKINTRQMKLNCIIQAVFGCLPIHEPSLNQEAMKIMRVANRICKCLLSYVTRQNALRTCPQNYQTVLNAIVLAKCMESQLWENSKYVSKQLKGIGPAYSSLLATAGKISFMLLEESHPRDLERIMKKSPPGGNVLRQQVCLLPKYQVTITSIDDNSITVHLKLLNQIQLAENVDYLTAGAQHKCYIVIGDSENYLLTLASFRDKDLITIYGGEIKYHTVKRHQFEHKIMAHCISSSFAGLDVHCEYPFQGLDLFHTKDTPTSSKEKTITRNKQTAITDSFKMRKRTNYEPIETSNAEKKKCYFAIIEQNKSFTQSHDKSQNVIENYENKENEKFRNAQHDHFAVELLNDDQSITNFTDNNNGKDDEQVNQILKDVETQMMLKDKSNYNLTQKPEPFASTHFRTVNMGRTYKSEPKTTKTRTRCFGKIKKEKNNFSVIDRIQKKANNMSENDDIVTNEESTLANTVKTYIDEYLAKAKRSNVAGTNVLPLLEAGPNKSFCKIKTDERENSLAKGRLESNDQNSDYCTQKIINNTLINSKENDKAILIHGNKNIEMFKSRNEDQNNTITTKVSDTNKTNSLEDENKLCEHILDENELCENILDEFIFNSFEEGDLNNTDTRCVSDAVESNNCAANRGIKQNMWKDSFDLHNFQNKDENDPNSNAYSYIYTKNNEDANQKETRNYQIEHSLNTSDNVETISDLDNVENYTAKSFASRNIREKAFDNNDKINNEEKYRVNSVNPDQHLYNNHSYLELNKVEKSGSNKASVPMISSSAKSNVMSKVQIDLNIIKNKQKQSDLEKGTFTTDEEELPNILVDNKFNEHQKKVDYLQTNSEEIGCEPNNNQNYQGTLKTQQAINQSLHSSILQEVCEENQKEQYYSVPKPCTTVKDILDRYKKLASGKFCETSTNISDTVGSRTPRYSTYNNNTTSNQNEKLKRPFSIRDLDKSHRSNSRNTNSQPPLELDVSKLMEKIPESIKKSTEINKQMENELTIGPSIKQTHLTSFDGLESPDVPSQSDIVELRPREEQTINIQTNQETLNTKQLDENTQPLMKLDQVCEENQKEQYYSVPKPCTTVKDILDRYKKLASGNFCEYSTDTKGSRAPRFSTYNNNTTSNKNEKFKRPFSIKDLDKCHRSNSRNTNSQPPLELDHSKFIAKISESIKNSTKINMPIANELLIGPDIECTRHENVDDLESPDISPVTDSESPSFEQTEFSNDDLDLSQYMFNPKSLLESFVQDDIILPPPQFRDEPKRDSSVFDIGSNDLSLENEDTTNLDDEFDKGDKISIASTELETCTLSKDEEGCSSICKSVTTGQIIPSVADRYLQTTSSRKFKLNRFKYSRKKCYRVRK